MTFLNLCACAFKPERHKVCAARYAASVKRTQAVHVFVAKFAAHFLIAKERRVADDAIDVRPLWFRGLAVCVTGQYCITMQNVVELAENRLCGPANTVLIEPLEITYPDDHRRQFLRIHVGFQSV